MPSPAAPDTIPFLECRARLLATAADTGGAFDLAENLDAPPGSMPPLHVHHGHDEGFYVLEGELTIFTPGAEVTLRRGDFLLAPREVPHTYRVGAEPASWLVTSNPPRMASFIERVSALGDAPSPEALGGVAAEHDVEILGPPGALP